MKKYQVAAVIVSLGSLAALPACSQLGIHMPGTQASSPAPMADSEVSPDMVKKVQTALQQQGMYQGNIDGVWGPATVHAVQTYQQKNNLNTNGQLDEATLKSMNMMGNTANNTMAQPAQTGSSTPPAPPAPQAPAVSGAPNTPPAPPPAATAQ